MLGPPCAAQCKQPLMRPLRAHLLRTSPARSRPTSAGHAGPPRRPCLPPLRCQGRWEGTRSPRPPAPTGTSFQHRQLQPFPAEGAEGGWDGSVSPGVGLCCGGGSFTGGWCLGSWWERGTPGGNSSGAAMGHTGPRAGFPQGCTCIPGARSAPCTWRDRARGRDSSPAAGPWSCPAVCGGAGSSPPGWELSCLFAQALASPWGGQGAQGGVRAWRGGVWGGGPAPHPAAPC